MKENQFLVNVDHYNPALKKIWLYFLSGVTWSSVGIYLCSLTFSWYDSITPNKTFVFVLGGIILAILVFRFGFSTLAYQNIRRVISIPKEKVCVFAFQKWTSYPLVLVMISLGIFLRKYSPIPKSCLGILYIGIGGSLFLASLIYYKKILFEVKNG
jgi:hypothetical protein